MKRARQVNVSKKFPNRLKELRLLHGWSQQQVSQKTELHQKRISKYERGEILPTADILVKLADLYDVSLDYLLRDKIPENKKPDFGYLKNKEIFKLLQRVDEFDKEEQKALVSILNAFVIKNNLN